MAKVKVRPKAHQKEFLKIFDRLCYSRHAWEVWADFVMMFAAALNTPVDKERAEEREKRYLQIINQYSKEEQQLFPQLAAATVDALETNQEQDFLGDLYMSLGLGSHWHGQFFTPYTLCKAMAAISIHDATEKLSAAGWTAVADPACGAGATLLAAANEFRHRNTNYQERVLFVGQDLDQVAAMMCYIQLSLLGCPGYVAVGNTLTTPLTGHPLFPQKHPQLDIWYTPMYFSSTWHWRRCLEILKEGDHK